MRVFVTGASGWIGSALVPDLLAAGHQVTGLARSSASAAALQAAGVTPVLGDLEDLAVLSHAAGDADAVVHLAFRHDVAFSGGFAQAAASDVAAITAMGQAMAPGGALSIASGLLGLARDGVPATEADRPAAGTAAAGRQAGAEATLALAERGLRTSVVRLSPTNHGPGDGGFVPTLIEIARRTGVAGYPGDGSARWSAVHVSDSARLFRLAIEVAPPGSVLHAVGDEGIPVRAIAEAIAAHLHIPVRSVPAEQVGDHFGFLGMFLAVDSPATAVTTRRVTGWEPTGPGLLADLDLGHYFTPESASKYA